MKISFSFVCWDQAYVKYIKTSNLLNKDYKSHALGSWDYYNRKSIVFDAKCCRKIQRVIFPKSVGFAAPPLLVCLKSYTKSSFCNFYSLFWYQQFLFPIYCLSGCPSNFLHFYCLINVYFQFGFPLYKWSKYHDILY